MYKYGVLQANSCNNSVHRASYSGTIANQRVLAGESRSMVNSGGMNDDDDSDV